MATPARCNSKKVELSRSQTERFIGYYHSHNCLWNVGSSFYSRRDHRQAAYTSIAALMDDSMTAEQVPMKISALRTYYSKELQKEVQSRKSGAGREDLYKSTWEWFALLDPFLPNQVTQNPCISNMEETVLSEDAATPSTTTEPTNTDTTDNTEPAEGDTLPNISSPVHKRKRTVPCSVQEWLMSTLKGIEQRREQRESSNEVLFGKYIASELLNISDPCKRRELKFKIQQLIFEFNEEN